MPIPPIIQPGSITPYLACSPLVTCTHPEIRTRARDLIQGTQDESEQITKIYHYVRDEIAHSADSGQTKLVWRPVQILTARHALCFGKSHLLVALLRVVGIPAGFCYQRLGKEEESYALHGLAAVWLEDDERWVRLDARGNKPGIDARFIPHGDEQIAYPDVHDPGEWMDPHIYAEPWDSVIRLYELSIDVAAFIQASSQIHAPAHHSNRISALTPVSV